MPPIPSATDAYKQLQDFNTSRPAATAYTTQANNQYGVDAANKQVTNLQTLVGNLQNAAAAVAPSVAGRTAGTFTTQSQRDALTAREQQPILTDLGQQEQGLGQAQTAQGQAQSMAQQMASTLYAQDQQKYQSLLDQYNAANAASQFQQQLQAQQQQASAAQAYQQQQLAEQIREFNNQPKATSIADELGALGFGTNSNGAQVAGSATAAPPAKQQADYNFVRGLINEVNGGDGTTTSMIIKQARDGDPRSKQIMQSFYQLQGMQIPANFRSFLS